MTTSLLSRAATSAAAVVLTVLAAVAGAGTTASAAPDDNGDVKIHNSGTPVDDDRNEPQVCVFYLDAFGFDGLQQVGWHIDQQPPTGTSQVSQGTITLDENGRGYTTDMTLPDGHYKLYWTWEGENGAGKSKVFTVTCTSASPSASPSTSSSPSGAAPASPGVSPGGGPTLPVTGTPLWTLFGIAGLSIAAGLLLRTRRARHR